MPFPPKHFNWRIIAYAIRDAWPFWLALTGLALAILIGLIGAEHSAPSARMPDAVRFAGTVLQVIGLLLVAIGLRSMRRRFGRPSLLQTIASWFKRLAAAFAGPHVITMQGMSSGVTISGGKVRVVMTPGPDSPVGRRVELLERAVEDLRNELDAESKELRSNIIGAQQAIEKEARERRDEAEATARLLEGVAVGGLHLETVGLVWLILGVIGTSIPAEVARAFL